jgi:hypothetical protein
MGGQYPLKIADVHRVATFRVTLKYGPQKERNDHCVVRTAVGLPQAIRVGDTFVSGHPGDGLDGRRIRPGSLPMGTDTAGKGHSFGYPADSTEANLWLAAGRSLKLPRAAHEGQFRARSY